MSKGPFHGSVAAVLLAVLTAPVALTAPAETTARSIDIDGMLADLNAASDGNVALVTISCFEFHPEVVTVASNQPMLFYWDDLCEIIGHTVTSSGSTADPQLDLGKPQPPFPGQCFDSNSEMADPIFRPGNREYPLDLHFLLFTVYRDFDEPMDLETGEFNEHSKPCSTDASTVFADDPLASYAVVPYHCRQHGALNPDGQGMRGAIILTL